MVKTGSGIGCKKTQYRISRSGALARRNIDLESGRDIRINLQNIMRSSSPDPVGSGTQMKIPKPGFQSFKRNLRRGRIFFGVRKTIGVVVNRITESGNTE